MLACPGLDHAHRGFETFARECFEALRGRDDIHIELVKGTGARAPGERAVPTLTRDTRVAALIARSRAWEPFVVEHLAFAVPLIPLLVRRRPDVVFFSEWHLGRALAAWRQLSGQRFGLAFSNGALVPGGYGRFDRVQQLVAGAIEHTVERGESPDRQVLLPLGVAMGTSVAPISRDQRASLRAKLGLPGDRPVLMSAGAINRQKRIDYLIDEVAAMPEPRPYLLLAGQQEGDTPALRRLAEDRLGPDGYDIRTVTSRAMPDLYRASDAFVLASLWESFGRVLVEAQSQGLPCLAHEYPVMSWVLGDGGDTRDLRLPGAVGEWLNGLGAADFSDDARQRRHRSVYSRFSWNTLASRYVEMLRAAAEERGRRR